MFMAWRGFNRDVLAIHSSDLDEIAREHTRYGSKSLLQRGILYRHEKILLMQGRLQAQTKENNV